MLILGIDPGTTTTGYGLIEIDLDKQKITLDDLDLADEGENAPWITKYKSLYDNCFLVDYGLIETEKNQYAPRKYSKIYDDFINLLIKKHQPDIMAIERIFFAANATTAISVGQAQGVMFLAAHQHGLPVIEYAPPTIKKVVTGNGRAKKKEVEAAVKEILGTIQGAKVVPDKKRHITKTHIDNAVDAIAIALCHMFHLHDITLAKHNDALSIGEQYSQFLPEHGKL